MEVQGHLHKLKGQQREENQHGNRRDQVGPLRDAIPGHPTQYADSEIFLLDEQCRKAGGNDDRKQQLAEIRKAGHAGQI